MLGQWKVELAPGCVTCIDTDPINGTFAAYTSLDVHRVEIMEDNNINPSRFDEIVELIMAHGRRVPQLPGRMFRDSTWHACR